MKAKNDQKMPQFQAQIKSEIWKFAKLLQSCISVIQVFCEQYTC